MGTGAYSNGNTAIGDKALNTIRTSPGTALNNSAIGARALMSLQNNKNESTTIGIGAFEKNLLGENTGIGAYVGAMNVGTQNTAIGNWALRFNDGGNLNTAVGHRAMADTLLETDPGMINYGDGDKNTVIGANALRANEDGSENVAIGCDTMKNNVDGDANVAVGTDSGSVITIETFNTLLGTDTNITTGTTYGTAVGAGAIVERSDSIILGRATDHVGISTTKPAARLHVEGGRVGKITRVFDTVATTYTASVDDYFIILAPGLNTVKTVTLPDPSASLPGHIFIISNLNAGGMIINTASAVATDFTNGITPFVALTGIPFATTYTLIHDAFTGAAPTYHVLDVY